jgi:hypothetical protein
VEDFILELLGILFEAFFEYILAAIWAFLSRAFKAVFNPQEAPNRFFVFFSYFLLGLLTGGISLLFFPHRLVRPSRIPGASLIVSPLVAGLMMSLTGSALRRREKNVTRIESFDYGFLFALGLALVRFLWAT